MSLNPEEVAEYLQRNPEFFESHAHLLTEVFIPHPHGGRTIPLAERQLLAMRDKNRAMEDKLLELVEFGEENDAIGQKVHELSLEMLAARDLDEVLGAVYAGLKLDFAVDDIGLRLFSPHPDARPEFALLSAEVKNLIGHMLTPSCGPAAHREIAEWFDSTEMRSFASIPLRIENQPLGLLVLASNSPTRFHKDMGTLFLSRIGAMVAAAVSKYLPAR